jgi:photosystem II stability/assembly factor-like uncharacterized protein
LNRCFALAAVLALIGCSSRIPDSGAEMNAGSSAAGQAGSAAIPSGGNHSTGGSAGGQETSTAGMSSGGAAGSTSTPTGGAGGGSHSTRCPRPVNSVLAATAPALETGTWKNITPATHLGFLGKPETMIAQGIAMDPCDSATLYWGTTPYETDKGGLFKTTDGGGSWTKIGPFDEPLHIRVDPANPQHLYVGDGVRGSTQGFWVSHDGGDTWQKPEGFVNVAASIGITEASGMEDIYDVAADPTDFNHVLLSFHSPWSWNEFDQGAGVLESKDGGDSWNVIERQGWGQGHSIRFLFEPEQGIGDPNTWLLGTQGPGYWRTTDAGKTWKKVSDNGIAHGGGTSYYNSAGVLFASGSPKNLRSTDNGETWMPTEPGSSTCVFGDGQRLYSAPALGKNPFFVSDESDGVTWEPFAGGAQVFENGGPYEMVFDEVNRILYASMWEQGVWALKVPP